MTISALGLFTGNPAIPALNAALTPIVHAANFRVDLEPPHAGDVQGTHYLIGFSALGLVFNVKMDIFLNGIVEFPPGDWEIGLVQNFIIHTHRRQYSGGAAVYYQNRAAWEGISGGGSGILDSGGNIGDVWFDPPDGVKSFSFTTRTRQHVALHGSDLPTYGSSRWEGMESRCGGRFKELLNWTYNQLNFRAILAARLGGKSGAVYPLLVTQYYGCEYVFTVGSGAPQIDWLNWKKITPTETIRAQQIRPTMKLAISPTSPRANRLFGDAEDKALRAFHSDCSQYANPNLLPFEAGIKGFT